MTAANPWLAIPAADYEGHMGEAGVAQLGPLREIFQEVYREVRPRRVAVLGCGPGGGLDVIEASGTERFVGVDLNPEYLRVARQRHPRLESVAEWVCRPIEECQFEAASFDLIHAALLFEYVDPSVVLPQIGRWLAPRGVLSGTLGRATPPRGAGRPDFR
jgi:SAM-dependent methyltransferase